MKSDQINELAAALSKAQGEFPVLEKRSQAYNYKYADLAETLQAIQGPLQRNGLSLYHTIMRGENPYLITELLHSSGQWINTEMPLFFQEGGKINVMQAMGSAITYAKRYTISCLLNLAADKESDDDGVKSAPVEKKVETLDAKQIAVIEAFLLEFPSMKRDMLIKCSAKDVASIPKNAYEYIVTTFNNLKLKNSSKELINA